jgi:hypothetical protein
MANSKRDKLVTVRLSADEMQLLQRRAGSQRLPAYIRDVLFHPRKDETGIPEINRWAYQKLGKMVHELHRLVTLLETAESRKALDSAIDSNLVNQLKTLRTDLKKLVRGLIIK